MYLNRLGLKIRCMMIIRYEGTLSTFTVKITDLIFYCNTFLAKIGKEFCKEISMTVLRPFVLYSVSLIQPIYQGFDSIGLHYIGLRPIKFTPPPFYSYKK